MRNAESGLPEWWTAVPEGEKTLLHAIARMLRGAKRSQLQEVARAAAKWERIIGCFVKVRLMHERRPRRLVDWLPKPGSSQVPQDGKPLRGTRSGWVRIEGRVAGQDGQSQIANSQDRRGK